MPGTPFASDALKDITFSLGQGSFTLLIGPSGSGKTTLIQHLNGLLKPTSGTVYFDDKSIGPDKSALLSLRRRIGLVFQMPENQFFSPRNLGLAEDQVKASVSRAVEQVGLGHKELLDHHPFQLELLDRHPFQLSAGQKRLVAIAAVLSIEPEVLLDPVGKQILFDLLAYLNRTEKITILVSTHHLDKIAALADQLVVLNGGRLEMAGKAKAILARRAELKKLGLALPQVTEIIDELAERGLTVRTDIYSLSAASDEIIRLKRADQE